MIHWNDCKCSFFVDSLSLSQKTNFRLFQTERLCRRHFQLWWKWQQVFQKGRKHCGEKEKLHIRSNFSFSCSVFKRLILQTCKNQGLFGKGLTLSLLMTTQKDFVDSVDQDQTAQNVQSDLWSTLSTFLFYMIIESFLHLAMEIHF